MAASEDHLRLASRTQSVIDRLLIDPQECNEWIATTAFYKAVHLVEAMFDNLGHGHSHSHNHRLQVLRTADDFGAIYRDFKALFDMSKVARYLENDIPNRIRYQTTAFERYVPPAKIREKAIEKRLIPIEVNVFTLIGNPPEDFRRAT